MGIRIQPREIDVPEDDPFKNDLLDRKEPVEVLTQLVSNLEGPCVLAVDAAWGAGKTTFLRIWEQYLRNHEFPVVQFNAWETDFSDNPFVTLSTELTEGLRKYDDESLKAKIKGMEKWAKEVLLWTAPGLIRLAAVSIPLLGKEIGLGLSSYVKENLSAYKKAQKSVKQFTCTLQDLANTLSESRENRPLIVVIDELDRCRPSYAVELLEIAKHLFSVDHIVFVLAVNRSELAHSIKALYGSNFDGAGYLRRFFDVDFRLPEPEREKFIDGLLDATQINDYFRLTQGQTSQNDDVRDLLRVFFRAPDLSLRRIAQAMHRLGLVFASLRSGEKSFAVTAVVALIMRTIDSDLYHRFVRGEVSDLDVVDKMLEREKWNRNEVLFAKVIMLAFQEVQHPDSIPKQLTSPLLAKYEGLVNLPGNASLVSEPELNRASNICHELRIVKEQFCTRDWPQQMGFRRSVQRLELISDELIDEPAR